MNPVNHELLVPATRNPDGVAGVPGVWWAPARQEGSTAMRVRLFLAVFLAVLMVPGAAHAKGPDQATIDGEGMVAPMSVDGTEGAHDDLGTLADVAGLWPAVYGQRPDPMLAEAPKEDLGPKLVITWRLPDGGTTPDSIRQELYLYAEGGPVTFTPADQPFLDQRTTGGWFRTPTAIQAGWETLGLPDRSVLEGAATSATSSPPPARDASTGLGLWPAMGVIGVGLVVLAVVAARMTSDRRVRVGST
jgi:hypothetical protein